MWDPDKTETEGEEKPKPPASTEDFRKELFKALQISEPVRQHYGIQDNGDGTYWVGSLEVVNGQPEEVKVMLREFLKVHGRAPKPQGMPQAVRESLDKLYRKIDRLKAEAPKPRILRDE